MSTCPSPPLSITIFLTILAGGFAALACILGNLATSTIPQVVTPYLRFAWTALSIVVLLGIDVSVWQVRREALSSSPSPPARHKFSAPLHAPTAMQSHNSSPDYYFVS